MDQLPARIITVTSSLIIGDQILLKDLPYTPAQVPQGDEEEDSVETVPIKDQQQDDKESCGVTNSPATEDELHHNTAWQGNNSNKLDDNTKVHGASDSLVEKQQSAKCANISSVEFLHDTTFQPSDDASPNGTKEFKFDGTTEYGKQVVERLPSPEKLGCKPVQASYEEPMLTEYNAGNFVPRGHKVLLPDDKTNKVVQISHKLIEAVQVKETHDKGTMVNAKTVETIENGVNGENKRTIEKKLGSDKEARINSKRRSKKSKKCSRKGKNKSFIPSHPETVIVCPVFEPPQKPFPVSDEAAVDDNRGTIVSAAPVENNPLNDSDQMQGIHTQKVAMEESIKMSSCYNLHNDSVQQMEMEISSNGEQKQSNNGAPKVDVLDVTGAVKPASHYLSTSLQDVNSSSDESLKIFDIQKTVHGNHFTPGVVQYGGRIAMLEFMEDIKSSSGVLGLSKQDGVLLCKELHMTHFGQFKQDVDYIGVEFNADSGTSTSTSKPQGTFGVVTANMSTHTKQSFASKQIALNNFNAAEVKLLLDCKGHPNIPQLYGVLRDEETIHILQTLGKGNLLYWIQHHGGMPEQLVLAILRENAAALCHIHDKNITHLDVKTNNIVFGSNGTLLVDFGTAKKVIPGQMLNLNSMKGITCRFAAPEVIRHQAQTSSDIWSLGISGIHLLTGHAPWRGLQVEQIMYKLLFSPAEIISYIPPACSEQLKYLLRHMLCISPGERLTARQILEQDIIKQAAPVASFYSYATSHPVPPPSPSPLPPPPPPSQPPQLLQLLEVQAANLDIDTGLGNRETRNSVSNIWNTVQTQLGCPNTDFEMMYTGEACEPEIPDFGILLKNEIL